MVSYPKNLGENGVTLVDETFVAARSIASCDQLMTSSSGGLRFLACLAIIGGMLPLMVTSSWATPTTISITSAGTLTVDSAGTLTATLAPSLPSTGFFDVYTGTYSVSEKDFPTLPIAVPYEFTLTGSLTVAGKPYSYTYRPLGIATASQANELAMEAEAFVGSPSGDFFPLLFTKTFYTYDAMGNITLAAQSNIADDLVDIGLGASGPLSVFFSDGVYSFSTTGLTLIATPIPEPASLLVLAGGLLGFAAIGRRRRTAV